MSYDHLKRSALATCFAELITLPCCTLKTNYQNTNSSSIVKTVMDMYNSGGIRIFYKASIPALASQMFSTSSKYTIYRYLEENYHSHRMINGLCAGIISSLFTHPLDTVKIHWQMQTPFLVELKKMGPKIFYRGYSKTLGKVSVGSSLFFPLYDYFFEMSNKNVFVGSFLSAVTTTLFMHPIDYLKTRQIYGLFLYQGWNPIKYYKGLTLNLMRTVPHFMITMSIISYLNKINF